MVEAPKGLRLHIALFGRRNVGKSSLLNAMTGQNVAIVSDTPGTTTDPVEKTLEMAPVGPVVFLDTAGLDDVGELGRLRTEKSIAVLPRTDVGILATDSEQWGEYEEQIAALMKEKNVPFVVARTKAETISDAAASCIPAGSVAQGAPEVRVSAKTGTGLAELKAAIVRIAPESALSQPAMVSDLVPDKGIIIMVVPIDTGAPKGRIILPQVQAIRDSLDGRRIAMVVTEDELPDAISCLNRRPDLVVTDSQAVHIVDERTPADVPLTTFSILMSRLKGDMVLQARGAAALANLKPGDKILIQEACSHHPQKDDIGRVKIPRLLAKVAGGPLDVTVSAGRDFTEYTDRFAAVLHCGGCTITRHQMLARLDGCRQAAMPVTNYGMAISLAHGVLERVLSPFPDALAAYREAKNK